MKIILRHIMLAIIILGAGRILAGAECSDTLTQATVSKTRGEVEFTPLQKAIRTGLLNLQTSIDISKFKPDLDHFIIAYNNLLAEDIDLFYVDNSFRYGASNGLVTTVIPKYQISDRAEIEAMREKFQRLPTIQEAIRDGFQNLESSINVLRFQMDAESAKNIFVEMLEEDFDLFYVDNGPDANMMKNGVVKDDNGVIVKTIAKEIYPKYLISDPNEVAEMRNVFQERTAQILERTIHPDLNDIGKILTIHDFVCTHCDYFQPHTASDISVTAYGAIVNGKANCWGHTQAMRHLLQLLGFKTRNVKSTELNHGWLQVEIDGEFYNLDATWDNPVLHTANYTKEYRQCNNVNHYYFLCSNEKFLHDGLHDTWENSELRPAVSTRFDDYFWTNDDLNHTCSLPCFGDTAYIFSAKYSTTTEANGNIREYFPLYAYSLSTGELLGTSDMFFERWKVWNENSSYTRNYSNLYRKNNQLLFSTPTAIQAFLPDSNLTVTLNFTLPLDQGYIYGLWQDFDGDYYAILRKTDNDDDNDSAIIHLTWVEPNSLIITPSWLSLASSEIGQLSVSLQPANVTMPLVSWSYDEQSVNVISLSDEDVLTRLVFGEKFIQTTVTVTAADNGITASCEVSICPPTPEMPANTLILAPGWNLVTLRVLPKSPEEFRQFSPRTLDPATGSLVIAEDFELNRSYWFFSAADTTFSYETTSSAKTFTPQSGKTNLTGLSDGNSFFDLNDKFNSFWSWDGSLFRQLPNSDDLQVGVGNVAY